MRFAIICATFAALIIGYYDVPSYKGDRLIPTIHKQIVPMRTVLV